MDFHTCRTMYDGCRAIGVNIEPRETQAEWYARNAKTAWRDSAESVRLGQNRDTQWLIPSQVAAEKAWLEARRPYYSVYPLIADSLIRLPLDLDAGLIKLPLPQLFVRFAKGHELDCRGDGSRLARSIMAVEQATRHGPGMLLLMDFGEHMDGHMAGFPVFSYRNFPLVAGETLEAALAKIDYHESDESLRESAETTLTCVRLICTLCLLGNDPAMVTPDVLADDRQKFADSGDDKYVDKAVRRGKRGWLIGAKVEVDPHYRRPHFALRWTGKGKTVPKIVPIKGSVVHRHKLSEVPTGFLDDEAKTSPLAKDLARAEADLADKLNTGEST